MTSEIFYELKNPGDEHLISIREFIDKSQKIKLKGYLVADDSEYSGGTLKYFKISIPSLGEFGGKALPGKIKNEIMVSLRFKSKFLKARGEYGPVSNVGHLERELDEKIEGLTRGIPSGSGAGFFGARGLDASLKAFGAFLLILRENEIINDSDMDNGIITAIKRHPQGHRGIGVKGAVMNKFFSKISNRLEKHLNVSVEGVAGSGKSHMLQELRSSGAYGSKGSRIEVVVFHPSTSYEEFVSGIRPNFSKQEGESDFVTQEGIFVQMCNRAAQDPDNTYLLFIDEINRANTARVFGDLMLVLEKSKRQEFKDLPQEGRSGALFEADHQNMPGDYVRLQTPIFKNDKEYNKLAVPTNLHVLGTMNTTDRSVGTIDLALRRRFHWVTQHPFTAEELQEAMEENGEDYPEEIASWYENTNTILLNKVGPDARLGHAYFFGKDGDEKAIAEALLNQLKEVAFTFNISQTILDDIGPVHGQKIITRGSGLGARPDIVEETYQG